jgi:hypothetical protein
MNILPRINFYGVLTVLCSEIRHCAKRQTVTNKPKKKDTNMKIDKTTYKYRKERQIGMTTDRTSRPDKVLFFADPHFLFLKACPQLAHCLLPFPQANASQKSKSQYLPYIQIHI